MMRSLALSVVILGSVATIAAAQPPEPGRYDPRVEASYGGVVTSVISVVGPDGNVGVHLNLKTATGTIVKVHVGPAMFIGMNNFSFLADDLDPGDRRLRQPRRRSQRCGRGRSPKRGRRSCCAAPDGTPRWPSATADDPDGCGVSHDRSGTSRVAMTSSVS